jgi:uncharacterized membrane protein YcfT
MPAVASNAVRERGAGSLANLPMGPWGVLYQLRRYWVFIAAGAFFSERLQRSLPRASSAVLLSASLASFIAVACCATVHPFALTSLDALPKALRPTLATLFSCTQAALGIAMVLALAVVLERVSARFLQYLGAMSLEIYVAHVIAASGIRIVMQKFAHISAWWPHLLAGMLVGLLIPLLAAHIAARSGFPYLFTLKKPVADPPSTDAQGSLPHSPIAL